MPARFSLVHHSQVAAILGLGLALSACASAAPLAPTVVMLPRAGETYAVFQQHDLACRTYASNGSGFAETQQRQTQAASTVAGAGVGAAAGALIGSASGHAGNGAAIGAGTGLLVGTISGQQNAARNRVAGQQHYDAVYTQCMVANGERLPSPAPMMLAPPPHVIYVPPPPVIVYRAYPPF